TGGHRGAGQAHEGHGEADDHHATPVGEHPFAERLGADRGGDRGGHAHQGGLEGGVSEVHLQVQRHDDPYAGGAQEVHRDDEDAVAERLIGEDRGVHHGAVAAALVVPLPHPPHPQDQQSGGEGQPHQYAHAPL